MEVERHGFDKNLRIIDGIGGIKDQADAFLRSLDDVFV